MLRFSAALVLSAAFGLGWALSPAAADVIFENKGLYKKETWDVQKYYDDLDDPTDAPGVITSGKDPEEPSGPALDFESQPNPLEDVED